MHRRLFSTGLLAASLAGVGLADIASAADDGLQGLDATQKKVVAAFLRHQGADGQAPSADRAFVTADGRIVLLWTAYFGNSQASNLALLERGPKGWRQSGKAELRGNIEQVRLDGDAVRVDALTLGPKDARCCPTVKLVQRFSVARHLAPLR